MKTTKEFTEKFIQSISNGSKELEDYTVDEILNIANDRLELDNKLKELGVELHG